MRKGLVLEDINQELDDINIYASEFFSPYNYINGDNILNNLKIDSNHMAHGVFF